jgi:hypothetical protein
MGQRGEEWDGVIHNVGKSGSKALLETRPLSASPRDISTHDLPLTNRKASWIAVRFALPLGIKRMISFVGLRVILRIGDR